MRSTIGAIVAAGLLIVAACQVEEGQPTRPEDRDLQTRGVLPPPDDGDDGDDGDEVLVPLDEIPGAVKAAAVAALPGLVIEEAELEEDGRIYCVHGKVDGVFREVEVAADASSATVEPIDDDDGCCSGDVED